MNNAQRLDYWKRKQGPKKWREEIREAIRRGNYPMFKALDFGPDCYRKRGQSAVTAAILEGAPR